MMVPSISFASVDRAIFSSLTSLDLRISFSCARALRRGILTHSRTSVWRISCSSLFRRHEHASYLGVWGRVLEYWLKKEDGQHNGLNSREGKLVKLWG